jgi:hypothetical protein
MDTMHPSPENLYMLRNTRWKVKSEDLKT